MLRSLAAGKMLTRRPRLALRRPMSDGPSSFEDKISKLSEAERAQVSKYLDEMDAELQGKLEQHVDAYLQRRTFSNDRGYINCVLTFCRVPKGERREKLIWRSNLAATFIVSLALGSWEAHRCLQYHYGFEEEQEEDTATNAAYA